MVLGKLSYPEKIIKNEKFRFSNSTSSPWNFLTSSRRLLTTPKYGNIDPDVVQGNCFKLPKIDVDDPGIEGSL